MALDVYYKKIFYLQKKIFFGDMTYQRSRDMTLNGFKIKYCSEM